MTEEDYPIVQAMKRYGGSFVQALARAAEAADQVNFVRLKLAFPDYWGKYAELAATARKDDPGPSEVIEG